MFVGVEARDVNVTPYEVNILDLGDGVVVRCYCVVFVYHTNLTFINDNTR